MIMSPEYDFRLKITAADAPEAFTLKEFLLRIQGIEEITFLNQYRSETQEYSSTNIIIDLTISAGQVVRAWREVRGIKLTELARQAGRPITRGYLSSLEHNKIQNPGYTHLSRLAEALSISIEDIIIRRMPPKEKE